MASYNHFTSRIESLLQNKHRLYLSIYDPLHDDFEITEEMKKNIRIKVDLGFTYVVNDQGQRI